MTTTRIQLALNVDDIDEATTFYTRLFGVAPHKRRDGYANFVIADPPLKLVLIERPGAGGGLNHLGVEAQTPAQVDASLARFSEAGLPTRVARQDVCCNAEQHKVFVDAPDVPLGFWEFYAVTEDNPANPANPDGAPTSVCELTCAAGGDQTISCCG
ncbi:ArsI/CadI family heavy metal resistance metalloenzyme [Pseudonocardia sp. WMMC193]|uniref:ArsI/CadI family heavy metal resistance metalloenzyme n=1 Tax=Pseudonocardia sp. WMMC193 TaxID=2911965 RepID=UPI001F19242A|nr:ArsI/CadI family heavy metal resistance metalloenzyme [Pseudonocardia sp. WMMC193]MCF7547458.1 VOC family protein [Pseudonocardia sp. WMMC193]